MRKQTKLVAVLSAAALLAVGASMTSFAATGWQEENGEWVYYNKDGDQVTDTWAKSGDAWFYLNGDGVMATDELIDDGTNYYYVNSNGAMVANGWVAVENENAGDSDEPDAYWYYFQANGKAYKSTGSASFKTINGKQYAFDSEGKMLYGWVNKEDATRITGDDAWQSGDYYCGDENDGARASGWMKLSVLKDDEDKNYWFYFNPSNGKKYAADDATKYAIKTINSKKYAFNEMGVMQDGWTDTLATDAEVATITEYQYFNGGDEGWRLQKGWVKVVPAENVNKNAYDDDSTKWYYADGSGNVYNSILKTINNKKYAFNAKGEMISGLWALNIDSAGKILGEMIEIGDAGKFDTAYTAYDKNKNYAVYYFGNGDDGAAKTGNQTLDVDGDSYSYSFGTTGATKYKGVSETKKTLLVLGRKIKADKDYRYQSFGANGKEVPGKIGGYLVNTSASIMKKKTNLKDADGMYYCTNENGQVTYFGNTAKAK